MKVLLLHDIVSDRAVAEVLERAGHEVARCTDAAHPTFPCRGADGRCPLDGGVDVVVVVHDRPSPDLAAGELGLVCAFRDDIPVVLAGNHSFASFASRCDAVALDVEDVPAACDRAVEAAAARAAAVVTDVTGSPATVVHRGNRVVVRLGPGATQHQSTAAHYAAKHLYPRALTIDVTSDN